MYLFLFIFLINYLSINHLILLIIFHIFVLKFIQFITTVFIFLLIGLIFNSMLTFHHLKNLLFNLLQLPYLRINLFILSFISHIIILKFIQFIIILILNFRPFFQIINLMDFNLEQFFQSNLQNLQIFYILHIIHFLYFHHCCKI